MKRIISLLLLAVMTLNLVACTGGTEPETVTCIDLLEDVPADTLGSNVLFDPTDASGVSDFAVRLLQHSAKAGENTLLSPLSVLYALAMTGNGAKEETLRQMEAVLGQPIPVLNAYLEGYSAQLAQMQGALKQANSIWFTDHESFTVEQSFLQTVKNHYDASVYRVPFDDVTCRDINNWVKQKTDGMIPEILDRIPEDAVMYLVNALAFQAKWAEPYDRLQVQPGEFTTEDGTKRPVDMLHSEESHYLELENAIGVMKLYEGGDYAFAALLPNDCTVAELVESLDGAQLERALRDSIQTTVLTAIPKFETGYSTEMSEVLKTMGMPDAFDSNKADFSGLGISDIGDLYISRVLHKTFLSLGEQGTEAGAATVVEIRAEGAIAYPKETKTVFLDRPFVYMIIDTKTCTPIFLGTMMDPSK